MERQLSVSFHFLKLYINAITTPPHSHPRERSDKEKFNDFMECYLTHGFGDAQHFPGRLKDSTDVDTNDRQFVSKVQFARKHRLWHYHIGIPCYECSDDSSRGDWLSAYLLNFQRFSDSYIKLVDLNSHPPFELPDAEYLDGEVGFAKDRKGHLRVVK